MMSLLRGRNILLIGLLCNLLAFLACSEKPKVSKETPEYHFSEAKKAMAEIKYEKAIALTGEILTKYSDSDYALKARILRTILMSGLSEGYKSMSDAYVDGYEKATKNPGAFRSAAFDYFRKQKSAALALYESSDYYLKEYSEKTPYVLDCDFPSRDVTMNRDLDNLRSGRPLDSEQLKVAEEMELQNQVLLTLTRFVGAKEDRAQARKLLESGPLTLNFAEFMVIMARTMLDNQKVFARMALNDPTNFRQFFQKAKQFSELAQKLLKEKPDKEIQGQADRIKMEIEALEKKGAR
jgi:hypothetical protein